MTNQHIPVMANEVMEHFQVKADGSYWDGTFGRGGHSRMILEKLSDQGVLYASDRDVTAEAAAQELLGDARFRFLPMTIEEATAEVPDQLSGFFWDLGCSTPQLKDQSRGFSFKENGPLDMRMDTRQEFTAADLVNQTEETELANLIFKYGEERFSRRIAARIINRRREQPFSETEELAQICRLCYPRKRHRIDPATRTFQALRIVVNDELGQIERSLPIALNKLASGGRAVIISFHSLEDRIIKHTFRQMAKEHDFKVITKKPLIPSEEEAGSNPAARSAKMRVLERS